MELMYFTFSAQSSAFTKRRCDSGSVSSTGQSLSIKLITETGRGFEHYRLVSIQRSTMKNQMEVAQNDFIRSHY